jgi:uncharacterized protein (TIGR02266 family)
MNSNSSHTDERRSHLRTPLTLKVEYPSLEGFLHDYTVNISRGGTMVRTHRELDEGDPVKLVLSFPGLLEPISLPGEVRWVREEEEEGEQTAGVAFVFSDDEQQDGLDVLVGRIKNGDPEILAQSVRILVVEDNTYVARLIREGLTGYQYRTDARRSFTTEHASNGKEALDRLRQEHFDLLIVDIYLPVMDGETLIRTLRREGRWAGLPIIAVSAGAQEAREEAIQAGADFFLDKPFRLSDIITSMQRLMAARRVGRSV